VATPNIIEASGLGHAVTPEQWAAYVLEHLSAQSVVLAAGATRVDTANRVIHVPRVLTDGVASWYSELETITADGPTGDDLVLTPRKCATLVNLSNESVEDSSPAVLDVTGTAMVRAVALEADRAILSGTGGKQPTGVVSQAGGHVTGGISIDGLINASGQIAAVGGTARAAFLNPADVTTLMPSKDGQQRPLLGPDYVGGPTSTVYGVVLWPTPAMPAGTALVADPKQIVVAVRNDPTVAVSTDAIFTQDGAVARVIARLDGAVNDPRGLVTISATAVQASKSTKSSD
jgi:HK97 family phage major capsid protein